MRGLLVTVLLMSAVFAVSDAIQCLSCTWTTDASNIDCLTGINIDRSQYCTPSGTGRCSKIVTKTGNTYTAVTRGCDSNCNEATTGNVVSACCNSDFCNSSTNLKISAGVLLLCLISALLRLNMY